MLIPHNSVCKGGKKEINAKENIEITMKIIFFFFETTLQLQADREKYAYDYDNLQSQLDKSQGQLSRVQKEKETIQQELDRTHDKYDKHQVTAPVQPLVVVAVVVVLVVVAAALGNRHLDAKWIENNSTTTKSDWIRSKRNLIRRLVSVNNCGQNSWMVYNDFFQNVIQEHDT